MKRIHQVILILGLFLAGALQAQTILTTIRPVQLLVDDLLPQEFTSQVLLGANTSPHHYALKLSDMKRLASASLVLWVGPEFETFLIKPISQLNKETRVIALDQIIEPDSDRSIEARMHEGHDHAEDAHIWLSYRNSIKVAEYLGGQLIQLYPHYSDVIALNLASLKAALESDFERNRAELAAYAGHFAVYHDGYNQFVAEMGLDQRAHITLQPEQQVSLKQLIELKNDLSEAACLLAEVGEKAKAQKLGDKLKLPVVTIDLLAIESQSTAKALGYPQYMNAISAAFKTCLSAKTTE